MREKLEALGNTPTEIITNLRAEGCDFGMLATSKGQKGCIMQQWFAKHGTPTFAVNALLFDEINPQNKWEIWDVVMMNDFPHTRPEGV